MRSFILSCWLTFLGYWLATAFWSKPTAERENPTSRAAYVVLLALGAVLFASAFFLEPWPLWRLPHGIATNALAVLLCTGGLLAAIWARHALGDNWSSAVTFKRDHELVTRGPYRFVRHPIYTGMLLMFLGSAVGLARVDGYLGFAFCMVSFWRKLQYEERLLERYFPAEYPCYKARVKAVVPFVL